MGVSSILIIAFALAMDAFVAAVSSGMVVCDKRIGYMLKFGLYFGFFQFAMTVIGFFASYSLSRHIISLAPWIAFALLGFLGINMIYGSMKKEDETSGNMKTTGEIMSTKNMIILAVATSIDAMAVGISFSFLEVDIFFAGGVIGVVAFVLSFLGYYFGCRLSKINIIKKYTGFIGGGALLLIGAKILIENFADKV